MTWVVRSLITAVLILSFFIGFAQKVDTINIGKVKGIILDSVERRALRSATISFYRTTDSTLIGYQLSSNQGEFNFSQLPINTNLDIVVSFIGYSSYKKRVLFPVSNSIDLKEIFLQPARIELNAVEIKSYRPPVQMRGDTLEFNAEAFKLGKTAVVDDLLRKLPGVLIWGDGLITVNGKAVKKVLVEGKPFFGGDATVALQNLPKDAVDKIQVYNASEQNKQTLDTTYNLNIKLKDGWKSGLFGKFSAGYGTDGRYMLDMMVSSFSPRTQISLVSAANNNNIVVDDVGTLVRNGSFKGTGIKLELQPDFYVEGLNKSKFAGINFSHDFIPDASDRKANRLENSYFVSSRNGDIVDDRLTSINIRADSNLIQTNERVKSYSSTTQKFTGDYKLETGKVMFYIRPRISITDNSEFSQTTGMSTSNDRVVLSSSFNKLIEDEVSRTFSLATGFKAKHSGFQFDYSTSFNSLNSRQQKNTSFQSQVGTPQNISFDRNYGIIRGNQVHDISFKIIRLEELLAIRKSGIIINFINDIRFRNQDDERIVDDLDKETDLRLKNSYLTNNSIYNIIDERPNLRLERTFEKSLSNRFSRTLYFELNLIGQLYNQSNLSGKDYQNFNKTYKRFIPSSKIKYIKYNALTKYKTSYELNYVSFASYPTVEELAPLVDSTEIYFRQYGNKMLESSYTKELGFTFALDNYNSRNSSDRYKITLKVAQIDDAMVNRINYDALGRAFGTYENVGGSKSWAIDGEARKAFKFDNNLLQFILTPSFSNKFQPNFVNGKLNTTSLLSSDNNFVVSYAIDNFFLMEINERLYFSKLIQKNGESAFQNSLISTRLIASMNVSKKLSFNTNITYNKNASTYADDYNFTLWNVNLLYRFLKGNVGEVKFSALDILRQNKGVINFGSDNTLTTGNVNVIQQYFMISLAYYPRIFGKSSKR